MQRGACFATYCRNILAQSLSTQLGRSAILAMSKSEIIILRIHKRYVYVNFDDDDDEDNYDFTFITVYVYNHTPRLGKFEAVAMWPDGTCDVVQFSKRAQPSLTKTCFVGTNRKQFFFSVVTEAVRVQKRTLKYASSPNNKRLKYLGDVKDVQEDTTAKKRKKGAAVGQRKSAVGQRAAEDID